LAAEGVFPGSPKSFFFSIENIHTILLLAVQY